MDADSVFNNIFVAVSESNWRAMAAFIVVAIVYIMRTYVAKFWPLISTDRGGVILSILSGVAGALATAWLANQNITFGVVMTGIQTGVMASGGYTMAKRMVAPKN